MINTQRYGHYTYLKKNVATIGSYWKTLKQDVKTLAKFSAHVFNDSNTCFHHNYNNVPKTLIISVLAKNLNISDHLL